MTGKARLPFLRMIERLVFLYIFRDFDKGTFDAGVEFTTLTSVEQGTVLCTSMTANVKGLRRDSFLVDRTSRHIVNLPGRYIVYWVNGKRGSERIYNRTYRTQDGRTYTHISKNARSQLTYDEKGLERAAENLVFRPRRYYEKFIRLLRF